MFATRSAEDRPSERNWMARSRSTSHTCPSFDTGEVISEPYTHLGRGDVHDLRVVEARIFEKKNRQSRNIAAAPPISWLLRRADRR